VSDWDRALEGVDHTYQGVDHGPSLLVLESTPGEFGTHDVLKANPLLELYRQERLHLMKVSEACIKAGVARMQIAAFLQASQTAQDKVFDLLESVVSDPRLATVAGVLRDVIGERVQVMASQPSYPPILLEGGL
jgi:hypothetical protein